MDNSERIDLTKIAIRIGDIEVVIEGTYEHVTSIMGGPVFTFIKGIQEVVESLPESSDEQVDEKSIISGIPQIRSQNTLTGTIRALMDKEWGKQPHSLADIMRVLETNGIYYSKGTVSSALLDQVKQGALRRLGSRGSYKYVRSI